MTDYTTPSGAGQLMIRDQGSIVEFWVYSGYNLSWNNLRFNVDANGVTTLFSINYHATRVWMKVGSIVVNSSQDVTFRLLDRTNTSSLGGPTSMTRHLERGGPPPTPKAPIIRGVGATNIDIGWADNGNGGVDLDIREIGWGKNPVLSDAYIWIGDTHDFTGLDKGTTYYFWAHAHNAKGWSPWGPRSQATTLKEPNATTPTGVYDVTQTSFRYLFTGAGSSGPPESGYQVGYGTDPGGPTTLVTSNGDTTLTGLAPATGYYVWSRAQNPIGWGPWSLRTFVRTRAGAYIPVGGIMREAIPYVKVDGVWRVVEPWVKHAGVWKVGQ